VKNRSVPSLPLLLPLWRGLTIQYFIQAVWVTPTAQVDHIVDTISQVIALLDADLRITPSMGSPDAIEGCQFPSLAPL